MKKEVTKQENGKYTLTLSPENAKEKESLSRIEAFSKIGTAPLYTAINLSEEDKKSLESETSQAQQSLNREMIDRLLRNENISKSELDDILKEFVERFQEIEKAENLGENK